MGQTKHKIELTEEQETLLITLYAKAKETEKANPIIIDQKAREILEQIEYNFAGLNIPEKTNVLVCLRAEKIDEYTFDFLNRYPKGTVLHLGCGLDSRYLRINNAQVEWFDLDMPDVIELRRKLYEETGNYHMIGSSVTDLSWVDKIPQHGQPVLVIAEGLLMYLNEADVKALFLKLKRTFPVCEIVFDAFSTLTAKSAKGHPSIKQTDASFRWGIDDPKSIEQWADGIQFKEEWFFSQSPSIAKLSLGYRLAYKLAGFIQVANKAHRILYFHL